MLEVVPLVGTWIEIKNAIRWMQGKLNVVPLVGTWIEIPVLLSSFSVLFVVPLVGTWIEISPTNQKWSDRFGRSPRGNVD